MDITQTLSITININGTNYSFSGPHPIEDLIQALTNEQGNLALWNQRATDSQSNIDNLNAQITALCTTPAP